MIVSWYPAGSIDLLTQTGDAMPRVLVVLVSPLAIWLFACQQPVEPDPHSTRTVGLADSPITAIDLGTLGGNYSVALGINGAGQVVGYSLIPGNNEAHAFIWESGSMRDLRTLPGGLNSYAHDVNESGQIVGYSEIGNGRTRAVLWEKGMMRDLGTLGGESSVAVGINNLSQIVGWSYKTPGRADAHAFLWDNGTMTDLGILDDTSISFPYSHAFDINDAGQIVGSSYTSTNNVHAILWHDGAITDLGTLAGIGDSDAVGINALGQISGTTWTSMGQRAYRWEDGVMTELGTLGSQSYGYRINDLGDVVGMSSVPGDRAFVWTDGIMIDLSSPGDLRSVAFGINNLRQVVGSLTQDTESGTHATMWVLGAATPGLAISILLSDARALPLGEEEIRSLTSQLEGAARLIGKGGHIPAANLLMAFVHRLEVMVSSGRLIESEAQPLIDAAREIVSGLL